MKVKKTKTLTKANMGRIRQVSEPPMAGIGSMPAQPAMAMRKGGSAMKGKKTNGAKAADCYKKGGMVKKPMGKKKGC